MAEHVEVLELLIKHGRTDVRLIYNTNLSHLYFKQVSFIDLWKKFNYVHLSLSLDDLAERAEYFRHGTQWQQITENLIRLRDEAPFIERGTYCTVSLFNVYYLPELINHLVDNDFIDPRFFEVNLLLDPPEYSVQVLPAWAKEKAAQKLKAHGLFWRSQGEPQKWGRIIYEIDSVMRYMQAADRAELLPRTQQMIQTLDRLRGESFATTYPELAAIME